MNLLIKQVTIADPNSSFNGKTIDVLIVNGNYQVLTDKIATKDIPAETKIIEGKGDFLSPGWFDMHVNFREPGEEQKETIKSGQLAAAQGGFTGVLMMPSTKFAIQTRSDVEYAIRKGENNVVSVFQAGALTKDRAGKEINEIYDMQLGGAVAFCDDKRSIQDSGIMLRALQYAGNLNAKIIAFVDDKSISREHLSNESSVTTLLGFKGSPTLAEEIDVQRLVALAEYTNQPLHLSGVSSRSAIEIIRNAKAKKLPITAEVYAYHLLLTDNSLNEFDTNYKVKPPLRSEEDRIALIEALLDGTVDTVVSDHSPEDSESKVVEFDYAAFGMIGLESAFGVLVAALDGKGSPSLIANLLSINPRKILGLPIVSIQENSMANFTIFNLSEEWKFERKHIKSFSQNTPFVGSSFKGKTKCVFNNGAFVICD